MYVFCNIFTYLDILSLYLIHITTFICIFIYIYIYIYIYIIYFLILLGETILRKKAYVAERFSVSLLLLHRLHKVYCLNIQLHSFALIIISNIYNTNTIQTINEKSCVQFQFLELLY